jgi:hypothetical protein
MTAQREHLLAMTAQREHLLAMTAQRANKYCLIQLNQKMGTQVPIFCEIKSFLQKE